MSAEYEILLECRIDDLIQTIKELKLEIEQLKSIENIADTYIKMYENKCKEVDRLNVQIKKLKECVEFYSIKGQTVVWKKIKKGYSEAIDNGDRARRILKEIDDESN